MTKSVILASGSTIRAELLRRAGVDFDVLPAKVDEEALIASLVAENAPPRDIADTLAEMKARKIAFKHPEAIVLGCDQVLKFRGKIYSKPRSIDEAAVHLRDFRGERHSLVSAVVAYEGAEPIWRKVSETKLTMRNFSDAYLAEYLERNWQDVQYCVGGYQIENEGIRLFNQIDGDYFNILGLPLIEVLAFLTNQGVLKV